MREAKRATGCGHTETLGERKEKNRKKKERKKVKKKQKRVARKEKTQYRTGSRSRQRAPLADADTIIDACVRRTCSDLDPDADADPDLDSNRATVDLHWRPERQAREAHVRVWRESKACAA